MNYRDVFILSRRHFWPSRERNVGSACVPLLCFCGNERWEEGRRKLFFSSFSWTSRFLSSLSLKKFTPFNKVHRFTQKWLSSLIGCCWHMLKATFKANTYFLYPKPQLSSDSAWVNKEFIPWGHWDLEDTGKFWWNLQVARDLSLSLNCYVFN